MSGLHTMMGHSWGMLGFVVKSDWIKWVMVALVVVLGQVGCGDREEAGEVGLEEMGYTATIEDFHRAAEIGDVAVMERLLGQGIPVDGSVGDGDTAMHAAAEAGSGSALVFLLGEGIEVDVRGAGDWTPLMTAAAANQAEVVQQLIRAGAKPELENADGYRALTLAADGGRTEVIEVLAVHAREDLDDALLLASLRGHAEAVGVLADFGGSVYTRMADGMTPLMLAAREGHEETVRVLRERGANRYALDDAERTAGQIALEAGHGELAAMLNEVPGEDEFELPALPQTAGEDGAASGAVIGALIGAAVGGDEDGEAMIGGAIGAAVGGGAGYSVGTEDEGDEDELGGGRDVGLVPPDGQEDGEDVALPTRNRIVNPENTEGAQPRHAPADATNPSPDGVNPVDPSPPIEGRAVAAPELVMERYEEKVLPLRVEGVEGDEARVRYLFGEHQRVTVKEGEEIPLTGLRVVELRQRHEHSKTTEGRRADVSVVVVEDPATGERRELVANLGANAHEPFAVLNNAGTATVVRPGTVVTEPRTGGRYRVQDVRPSQVVVENVTTGVVHTLPLRKGTE